jgi:PHP family Zn ribbon phosphoesterase
MKKEATAAEKRHMSKVAALCCVVCRNLGYGESPAELHHVRNGKGLKRASHMEVIPLCHTHHRTGGHGIAYHAGRVVWEENFGTEIELLEQVLSEVGYKP